MKVNKKLLALALSEAREDVSTSFKHFKASPRLFADVGHFVIEILFEIFSLLPLFVVVGFWFLKSPRKFLEEELQEKVAEKK